MTDNKRLDQVFKYSVIGMACLFILYAGQVLFIPMILVAALLNVSTWTTLVAIVAGGILWGVSGMILFITLPGILKIITDHSPEWEALNIMLRRKAEDKK